MALNMHSRKVVSCLAGAMALCYIVARVAQSII